MDILEILYSREFKKVTYNVRKVSIDAKKTLILGPRGSGKSTMIFDYLSQRERGSFLYIDFDDFRLKDKKIEKHLGDFLKKYNITLLVLENFNFNFDLPLCDEMIITTSQNRDIDGFVTKTLYPLDFEEFISFDKRELNLEAIFNSFASYGTFPAVIGHGRSDFVKFYQNFINIFANNELEKFILQLLSSHQADIVSIYSLFLELKQRVKISKDTFYSYIKRLQDEQVIFFVQKYGSKRASKKLYMIDFVLRGALSFEKDFIKRFENIIFLELMKRKKSLFYSDAFDFYLPDESRVILSIPFLPSNLIKSKLERLNKHFIDFNVHNVQIVTMELEEIYEQNGITYEMIPFTVFATSL